MLDVHEEIAASVERLVVTLALFALVGVILLQFGVNTATVGLIGPWIGAAIGAWFLINAGRDSGSGPPPSGSSSADTGLTPEEIAALRQLAKSLVTGPGH